MLTVFTGRKDSGVGESKTIRGDSGGVSGSVTPKTEYAASLEDFDSDGWVEKSSTRGRVE